MFCIKCGQKLPDNALFCPRCGTDQYAEWNKMKTEAQSSPRQEPKATPVNKPSAPSAAKPQPAKKEESPKGGGWKVLAFIVVVVFALLWINRPQQEDSEEQDTSQTAQNEVQSIEEQVPEGIPIIVDEARILYPDDPDEYTRLKQKFDEQLNEALCAMEPRVCVLSKHLRYSSVQNYDTFGEQYAYPYFWMSRYSVSGGGYALWEGQEVPWYYIDFTYSCDKDQLAGMQAEIDAAREDYLSLIPADADQWEAAKTVHDELVRRVTYDHTLEGTHCHDIYGALVEGSAVCQGYAYAFSYVMKEWTLRTGDTYRPDINYYPVVVSDTHAWNTAQELTYDVNLDVTWDDPDMTDIYGQPYIFYSYFGLTTEEIEKVDSHEVLEGLNSNKGTTITDPQPFSYYQHEGYYLDSFDVEAIVSAFAKQYNAGSNLLTVKFANPEDYERTKAWADSNEQELWDILARIGYTEYYYYWGNDDLLTYSIGLNAPAG